MTTDVIDSPVASTPARRPIFSSLVDHLIAPFRRGKQPAIQPATGFYTDTSVCIGCKACEVACKQMEPVTIR